mmetsp:Transcript_30444/g.87393  ORF Transcript_30444/g.87393 Transcript_30444/m.87393 type:complete len:215 (+) Transcript_30444:486-1130(+)
MAVGMAAGCKPWVPLSRLGTTACGGRSSGRPLPSSSRLSRSCRPWRPGAAPRRSGARPNHLSACRQGPAGCGGRRRRRRSCRRCRSRGCGGRRRPQRRWGRRARGGARGPPLPPSGPAPRGLPSGPSASAARRRTGPTGCRRGSRARRGWSQMLRAPCRCPSGTRPGPGAGPGPGAEAGRAPRGPGAAAGPGRPARRGRAAPPRARERRCGRRA